MSAQRETQPERRVESAQSIAARMARFATNAGFGAEWKLFGPALIDAHIDAAFETFLVAMGEPAPECVTFRYNLATGESSLCEARGQGEHRVILDGSDERDRLASYRGFCRLFNRREQRLISAAREIAIVTAPLDEWIAENEANPAGPCDGLRLIVVLPPRGFPPFDDSGHLEDCHLATHTAVSLARRMAGGATTMKLSDSASRIRWANGPSSMHIVFEKKCAIPSSTTEMLLDISSAVQIQNARKPSGAGKEFSKPFAGRVCATILASGRDAAYWIGKFSNRTITLSGFRGKDLPAALARRYMVFFDGYSGGGCIESSREIWDLPIERYCLEVWGDEPERPEPTAKKKATVLQ